ncbi:MAG: oligosaccharide flippase family protein [Methanobacterium sp.]
MKFKFLNYYNALKEHKNDSLFRNSYYLIGNTFITAAIGFFFWIIAARLFSPEDIGISSAIISVMSLISVFALLGFDISLIRFLYEQKDKTAFINSSFTLTAVISTLLSLVFLTGLDIIAPDLMILKDNIYFGLTFILITVFFTLFTLQLSVFIGFRAVKYSFFQSFINLSKIVLLPFLIIFGSFGIYLSFGLFYFIAFIAGVIFIKRVLNDYSPVPVFKLEMVKNMAGYSFNNYITNIFYSTPHFLLPLLVLNVLGPVINAYFYIAWTFASILFTIPFAVSRSFLAEGSLDKSQSALKSLKFTFILLFVVVMLVILFGQLILSLFGGEYALNAYNVLILLSLSSFPFAVVQIFVSLKRIKKDMKPVIIVNFMVALISILLSYVLMNKFGLIGVGFAWLTANLIIAITVLKYLKE